MAKRSTLVLCLIVIVFLLGAWLFFDFFPSQVESIFGEADPSLNFIQKDRLALRLYLQKEILNQAKQPQAKDFFEFQISVGDTASQVCLKLRESGLIPDEESFLNYLIYKGYDRILQSGTYYFSFAQTPLELADAMIDSTPEDVEFVILAGMRLEEIADLIPTSGLGFSKEEFIEFLRSPKGIVLPQFLQGEAISSFEGLIFAGKYTILRNATPADFLRQLLDASAAQLTPEMLSAFNQQGLTPYEALILASLVEREAVNSQEKALIASVFVNRLRANMPLQSDPTIQYALGWDEERDTWWKTPLYVADLDVDSPYNTYKVYGFPPTPICSVGKESLLAVTFPAKTQYLYFRSACDGSGNHLFAETFAEHQANACH